MLHSRFFTWSLAALFAALPFVVATDARAEEDEPVSDAAAKADTAGDDGDDAEAAPPKVVSKHKAKPGKKKVATKHKKDKSKVATKKVTKDKKKIASVHPKGDKAADKKGQKSLKDKPDQKLAKADSKKEKGSVSLSKGVSNEASKDKAGEPAHESGHKKKPRRPLKRRSKD